MLLIFKQYWRILEQPLSEKELPHLGSAQIKQSTFQEGAALSIWRYLSDEIFEYIVLHSPSSLPQQLFPPEKAFLFAKHLKTNSNFDIEMI